MFLQNPSAVRCALREHHTLVRLSLHQHQSAFLVTLICSLRMHGAPTFVLRKGSNVDLLSLARYLEGVHENEALSYSYEIICGLQCLHAMCIVHMDLKPENVLLSYSGHVLITDFDRTYDISEGRRLAEAYDFRKTLQYMAPEIANRVEITSKTDVWGSGP
ncbi:3-phosphoinositide-dependent protein kinase 1, partial [Taenia solium]